MTTMWIVIGLGVVAALVALIGLSQRGGQRADLGAVSNQWISEHRLGQNNDSRR